MSESSETFADAAVGKLAELLTDDEVGWLSAAHWIDERASDEGIDLFAQFDSAEIFARSIAWSYQPGCQVSKWLGRTRAI
jgi:hypothetical protein